MITLNTAALSYSRGAKKSIENKTLCENRITKPKNVSFGESEQALESCLDTLFQLVLGGKICSSVSKQGNSYCLHNIAFGPESKKVQKFIDDVAEKQKNETLREISNLMDNSYSIFYNPGNNVMSGVKLYADGQVARIIEAIPQIFYNA